MNNYIEAFDKLGCEYFSVGSDEQLRAWGHSEESILEIKQRCVDSILRINQRPLKLFKVLNELNGGVNVLPDNSNYDRFEAGIKMYGYSSDFRKEYSTLVAQVRHDELDEFFDKWNVPKIGK
jgi:hypothetical protein